jgi:S-adenosyl methyltransferase
MRDRAAITRFFDGLDLLEPGVVQPRSGGPSRAFSARPR